MSNFQPGEMPLGGYGSACASVRLNPSSRRNVKELFTVVDKSDGDTVVQTFRNIHVAERFAGTNPSYEVRGYAINMRD